MLDTYHTFVKLQTQKLLIFITTYSLGLSQFVPEENNGHYNVSFKALEERTGCNDAMDLVYDSLWDVTVLEYAVSMHTKRGDHARRRHSLANIGALEVNTNNNVEILRETANIKRFNFMRTLCKNFL